MSINVRFLENGEPQEKFLGFQECISGTTGEAIADNILSKLTDWKLEAELLRGQAYDGASAMAGRVKGAASHITAKYPKAIYTHCASHRVNLCIVKCCSISEVNNVMQVADKIARFFSNSPKKQATLKNWIQDILQGEKRKIFKEMCRTRWVERHEDFELFSDLFMPLLAAYKSNITKYILEWNRDSRSDAVFFTGNVTISFHCGIAYHTSSFGIH